MSKVIHRLTFGIYPGSGYTLPWTRIYPKSRLYVGSLRVESALPNPWGGLISLYVILEARARKGGIEPTAYYVCPLCAAPYWDAVFSRTTKRSSLGFLAGTPATHEKTLILTTFGARHVKIAIRLLPAVGGRGPGTQT
jgi:hypothetical protein